MVSALVLLELSVAFDTVDHCTVLEVLPSRFGIKNGVLEWLKSYRTGRTQNGIISSDTFAAVPLVCSIPQVLVVDALLFIAYTETIKKP